jgi:hypothetical protein
MIPILADDDDWSFDPVWDLYEDWDEPLICGGDCPICYPCD